MEAGLVAEKELLEKEYETEVYSASTSGEPTAVVLAYNQGHGLSVESFSLTPLIDEYRESQVELGQEFDSEAALQEASYRAFEEADSYGKPVKVICLVAPGYALNDDDFEIAWQNIGHTLNQ